jgi:hypothetical protein
MQKNATSCYASSSCEREKAVRAHLSPLIPRHSPRSVSLRPRTVFWLCTTAREKTPGFRWGYMDKKLGVGRTGGVGEAGRGWGRVALHLRDRLAGLAVCLPG